jgi:hypothetical protein
MAEKQTQPTELEKLQQEIETEQARIAAEKTEQPPEEYKVEIEGQVFKGASEKEVLDKLVKAQENATRTIREERQRSKELQQQLERSKPIATSDTNGTTNGEYDPKKYLAMWESGDFIGAENYNLQHNPTVQRVLSVVEAIERNTIVDRFNSMNPDFTRSAENGDLLVREVERLGGNPEDPLHLSAAWTSLKESGKVTVQEDEPARERPKPPPSPRARGGNGLSSSAVAEAEQMSTEDLDKYLRKVGMKQY